MSDDPVERAARAIATRRGCPTNYPPPCHVCEKADGCMGSARAVIASLREPTAAQVRAMVACCPAGKDPGMIFDAWVKGIDAALMPSASRSMSCMRAPYRFRRYVNGVEMAEGVQIDNAATLDEAMRKAAAICPDRRGTILVIDAAL